MDDEKKSISFSGIEILTKEQLDYARKLEWQKAFFANEGYEKELIFLILDKIND